MAAVPSSCRPWAGPSMRLAALGCLALAAGTLVYLTDRDPSHAALIPAIPVLVGLGLFGGPGAWIPSFAHPFAFSLFTAAIQPSRRLPAYWACAMWWAIDVAFEVAQAPGVSTSVAEALPHLLGRTRLTNAISNYLLQGTFAAADLLAATAGAAAAAAVLRFIHRREARDAR